MKKLLLILGLLLAATPAFAQNTQCANRPSSDDSNACANTRFVWDAITAGIQLPNHSVALGTGTPKLSSTGPSSSGLALISNGTSADPSFQGFLQQGTGAVVRTWNDKASDIVSVKDFGANGGSDDTAAIRAAIQSIIDSTSGEVDFPSLPGGACYHTTSTISIDTSSISTRYLGRIHLVGTGPGGSCISNVVTSGPIIEYIGGGITNPEAYFAIDNLRITGAKVSGSVGLKASNGVAFMQLRDFVVEATDTAGDFTDVEQSSFIDDNFRFNNQGITGNVSVCCTSSNSWTFLNTTVSNNSIYGLQITNANAITYVGGSIQYNGTIGGGSGQFGFKSINDGDGYGTEKFDGMVFEGNGGAGDYVSVQNSGKINTTFDTVSWARTDLTTVGYGTNQIAISGTGTNANYKIVNSNFWGYSPYTANAARPAIANTNANARVEIDGTTAFWSTVEAPTQGVTYLGTAGVFSGLQKIAGSTSGVITTQPQAAAGTYNWNWPTSAGTSGQPLLSGGGSGSPMTFGTLSVANGGTGATSSAAAMIALKGPFILGGSAVQVSHTGDTAETVLATIAVPANFMGPNGQLFLSFGFSHTNSANVKNLRVRLGGLTGTILWQQDASTTATTTSTFTISNRNNAASQYNRAVAGLIGSAVVLPNTTTVDTTSAQNLVLTGQLTNAGETVAVESYFVDLRVP